MLATEKDLASTTVDAQPKPQWWKRLHSWLFGGQVLGNLVLFWWCWESLDNWRFNEMILLGSSLGQLFLLGMWLALGGLHYAARYCLVAGVFLLGVLSTRDQVLEMPMVLAAMVLLLVNAALLPLRGLLGWRVNFDPAYHAAAASASMQIRIRDVLVWTAVCAFPFAVGKLDLEDDGGDVYFAAAFITTLALAVAAPAALAVVNRRRPWLFLLAAASWIAIVIGVEVGLGATFAQSGVNHRVVAFFNGGMLAAVAGNLLVMRLFGLHLFRVQHAECATGFASVPSRNRLTLPSIIKPII